MTWPVDVDQQIRRKMTIVNLCVTAAPTTSTQQPSPKHLEVCRRHSQQEPAVHSMMHEAFTVLAQPYALQPGTSVLYAPAGYIAAGLAIPTSISGCRVPNDPELC